MSPSFLIRPQSYQDAAAREWLVSNGLGGYASSTLCCSNTRAYHGLLVAALQPPADRWLMLAFLDEEIDGHHLLAISILERFIPRDTNTSRNSGRIPFPASAMSWGICGWKRRSS